MVSPVSGWKMPCAQSLVSEMMGEMAAWIRCRSISSAICSSEPRTTAKVTGSIIARPPCRDFADPRDGASVWRQSLADALFEPWLRPARSFHLHEQVAERIDARDHAGLDHGGRVVLLDDRGTVELHARQQILAG